MGQVSGDKNYFKFIKGLNTDASPIDFPNGFTVDEDNFNLYRDGSRRKRLGANIEASLAATSGTYYNNANFPDFTGQTVYIWKSPAANSGKTFAVYQNGHRFTFYDITNTTSLSGAIYYGIFSLDYDVVQSTGKLQQQKKISWAQVGDKLIGASQWNNPFVAWFGGLDSDQSISAATSATPPVITVTDVNSLASGQNVKLSGFVDADWVDLNDQTFEVRNVDTTANTFELYSILGGGAVVGAGFAAYTASGVAERTVQISSLYPKVRDLVGVDDGLEDSERPNDMYQDHLYNLINQGWTEAAIVTFAGTHGHSYNVTGIADSGGGPWGRTVTITTAVAHGHSIGETLHYSGTDSTPPIDGFYNVVSVPTTTTLTIRVGYDSAIGAGTTGSEEHQEGFPSNSDIAYLGKNSSGVFSKAQLDLQFVGNHEAPKGNVLYNIFEQNKSAAVSTWRGADTLITYDILPNDEVIERFTQVEFYSGRAWFSGMSDEKWMGTVFYSQSLSGDDNDAVFRQMERFHQKADPTNEYIKDLIDTDGGYIKIGGAGRIIGLSAFSNALLAFGENGVFAISGAGGVFTPTDFNVEKLINVAPVNAESIIETTEAMFFISHHDIYRIFVHEITGQLTVENISGGVLHTLLTSIEDKLPYSTGVFDPHSNRVVWAYFGGEVWPQVSSNDVKFAKDTLLIYDITLGAFTIQKLSHIGGPTLSDTVDTTLDDAAMAASPFIVDIYYTDTMSKSLNPSGAESYYTENEEDKLRLMLAFPDPVPTPTNYYYGDGALLDVDFMDWKSFDGTGVSYVAYIESGYETLQDAMRKKEATYVHCFFNRTETQFIDDGSGNAIFDQPSGCEMKARWDWSDHANSGMHGTAREVYRFRRTYTPTGSLPEDFDNGSPLTTSKNKVRGNGRALSIRLEATAGNDCYILGWAINYKGRSIA